MEGCGVVLTPGVAGTYPPPLRNKCSPDRVLSDRICVTTADGTTQVALMSLSLPELGGTFVFGECSQV